MNRRAEGAAATAQKPAVTSAAGPSSRRNGRMRQAVCKTYKCHIGVLIKALAGDRCEPTCRIVQVDGSGQKLDNRDRQSTRLMGLEARRGRCRRSNAGFAVFVVSSATGDASKIYSLFGSKPNYTKMQQVSFDNAGERL